MKLRIHRVIFFGFITLVLGLESCSSDKSNPSPPTAQELRLETPQIINYSNKQAQLLNHFNQTLSLSSLDTLLFPGFVVRNSDAQVNLHWETSCETQAGKVSVTNNQALDPQIFISQLLPPEVFLRWQKFGTVLTCSFDLVARQPDTRAQHKFTFSGRVGLPSSGDLRLLLGQTLVEEVLTEKVLNLNQFNTLQIFAERSDRFELHCDSFSAPLLKGPSQYSLAEPSWINPSLFSNSPTVEDPLQECRILGFNEGALASWSIPFVLRTDVPPPQIRWLAAMEPVSYKGRVAFPSIHLGRLEITNTNDFPINLKIKSQFEVRLQPLCVQDVRGPELVRAVRQIAHFTGDTIEIGRTPDHQMFRLGRGAKLDFSYHFVGDLECHCPDKGLPLFNGRTTPSPWEDFEAGYYFQLINGGPVVEVLDLEYESNESVQSMGPILTHLDSPRRWAGNMPLKFHQPFHIPESELNRRTVSAQVCR